MDKELVEESISKTNKVLILHEANLTGGIGAELIALITEECFDDLDSRPIRLSSQDIPTPYNGNLENLTIIHYYPTTEIYKVRFLLWLQPVEYLIEH